MWAGPHRSRPASGRLGSETSLVHRPRKRPRPQRNLADTRPGNEDKRVSGTFSGPIWQKCEDSDCVFLVHQHIHLHCSQTSDES